MKKATILLLFAGMMLLSTTGIAVAQNGGDDPITVTFVINTSTVADTLFEDNVVQMRGAINGDDTGEITWGANSKRATNVGGDYWELDLALNPGDQIVYKIWVGYEDEGGELQGLGFDGGWELNNPDPETNDYVFTVPAEADEDFRTEAIYVARPDIGREAPFTFGASDENEVAVHFRVNVGAQVATGDFDPADESNVVGVRGEFDRATGSGEYKFVLDDGASVTWEDGANRTFNIPAADTTLPWGFFNNRRPPAGDVIESTLQFSIDVGLLEDLGFFNRAVGDSVFVPGAFNGWDTQGEGGAMNFNQTLGIWTKSAAVNEEAGANIAYKYFIRWDDTRFDSESPNFIPGLVDGMGWEEPGITGGADRIYEFTDQATQPVPGDFGTETAFFNSLPAQAVLNDQNIDFVNAEEPVTVKFTIDMTDALAFDTPFDPEADSLFLILETPIFALTQGLSTGDEALETQEGKDRLLFSATEQENIFELDFELQLPTINNFGFVVLYQKEDGTRVQNGDGFDAGRRYYRYIEPLEIVGDDVFWAQNNELNPIIWKEEDLDFEEPPTYGIGENGENLVFNFLNEENGKATSIDWGETLLVLQPEVRLSEDNRNYFYSGTLYIQDLVTSTEDVDTGLVSEFELSQNFPNPFNPTTNIKFTLPTASEVSLTVYNTLGQRVATLVNNRQFNSGPHTVTFDASMLASGVYFYRIQAGNFVQQRAMTLIK
ncbi:MAG: T9SS type A sorting domain-containing protein [Balneolaceae bacterium]